MTRPRRLVSILAAAGLCMAGLAVASAAPGSAAGAAVDPAATATAHLKADATGAVKLVAGSAGLHFVGTAAGSEIRNPAVSSSTSVAAAADADISRYGAALGVNRAGTTLAQRSALPTATGNVVHYTQQVGGLPVIGGDIVVTLAKDNGLVSMLSTMSTATKFPAAQISQAKAQQLASVVATGKHAGKVQVSSQGRWVLDQAILGTPAPGVHSVWRIDVTRGINLNREVLVDDQTGEVLLNSDQNESANRVVCNNNNTFPHASDVPCTTGFARTEGQGATGNADIDAAYDLSGVVSDYYDAISGGTINLTNLIGRATSAGTALASTVNWCYTGAACPYGNAFWDGSQMFYGQGYAGADDVVGHEMTHGVTDRYSQLFYWGQSGAMNESQSDIMGEIMDHRHPSVGDAPTNWNIGEDIPDFAPLGLRNLATPDADPYFDPDRMLSPDYNGPSAGHWSSIYYGDNGGVHDNSGVGNHTAYLIMKGGVFNGQTIAGIDAGNDTYTKTGMLYLLVDQTLASGSDYADLALVLDQSCNSMVGGASGMTATDCTNVHKAGLATELAQTSPHEPTATDAPDTCPGAAPIKTVLFDSETGTPSTKFTAAGGWTRNENTYWGLNAHTNPAAWNNSTIPSTGATTARTESMKGATPIAIPAGAQAYLRFEGWYYLDNGGPFAGPYYDGGTVEVDDVGDANPPVSATALPWINGPDKTIASGTSSPIAGQKAFGGDSFGWVASRVDLSSYAGKSIEPQFSMSYDNSYYYVGWFVDDVTVYTCTALPPITNNTPPSVTGTPALGQTLTADPGTWTPSGTTPAYQWLRGGVAIGGAISSTYQLVAADVGTNISVQVTASKSGFADGMATSSAVGPVTGTMTAGVPSISGTPVVGGSLNASPGTWVPSDAAFTYQWKANGSPIGGATASTYHPTASDVGSTITVTVTGSKSGWTGASATSAAVGPVAPATPPSVGAGHPSITGKAVVGKKLTAVPGTWTPAGVTFTYQWLRNGAPISGATGSTYKLTNQDKGKKISVTVTGSKTGFTSASATSPETKKVKAKKKHHHHHRVVAGRLLG